MDPSAPGLMLHAHAYKGPENIVFSDGEFRETFASRIMTYPLILGVIFARAIGFIISLIEELTNVKPCAIWITAQTTSVSWLSF